MKTVINNFIAELEKKYPPIVYAPTDMEIYAEEIDDEIRERASWNELDDYIISNALEKADGAVTPDDLINNLDMVKNAYPSVYEELYNEVQDIISEWRSVEWRELYNYLDRETGGFHYPDLNELGLIYDMIESIPPLRNVDFSDAFISRASVVTDDKYYGIPELSFIIDVINYDELYYTLKDVIDHGLADEALEDFLYEIELYMEQTYAEVQIMAEDVISKAPYYMKRVE